MSSVEHVDMSRKESEAERDASVNVRVKESITTEMECVRRAQKRVERIRSKQRTARHRKIFIRITIYNVEHVVVVWVVRLIVDAVAIDVPVVSHRIVFALHVIRSVSLHLGGVIITNLAATVPETINVDSDVEL